MRRAANSPKASALPNPLPVRLAALPAVCSRTVAAGRWRSGRGEGEAASGLRLNQQLRDTRRLPLPGTRPADISRRVIHPMNISNQCSPSLPGI